MVSLQKFAADAAVLSRGGEGGGGLRFISAQRKTPEITGLFGLVDLIIFTSSD